MYEDASQPGDGPAPYPVIRALLARKRRIPPAGGIAAVLLGCWLGWRTGFAELYPIAVLLGAAAYFALKVAVEVVELVADTLMPR
ncbi:hypothetical protein GCM10023144_23800 [Pigmentiphaga soli]|uniref:Uncharacterized protein n=1 Tax=Pigmentiphaga soli TaxID=1007095 RepID=A0ABP8H1G9_9BURK